ncbi:hypothetical protein TcasGA2_TC034368 [Tribolium castaneum]|uniref:Uncharacterized protein n=1 Tax=Tribolium castaneum TaxID=7070 RepID=A0A139WB98_TRICA|nr:hypothetical protein TcasGA2_TC034368 [Tribolium castaneum]
MWVSSIAIVTALVCPHLTSCYNTNRQIVLVKDNNCGYYDNPVFKVTPSFIQSRMGPVQPTQQVVLVDNRLRKETPYYNTYHTHPGAVDPRQQYQPKVPVTYFPNITPADLTELHTSHLEEEPEEDIKVDYNKMWKVGEIPASKSITALPDVYVKPDDAPPIVDMLSMEQSELTEEAHDMENVEIEEKYLKEPLSQTKEVIIEKVTTRPEPSSTSNPALAMFKEIDMSKKTPEEKRKNRLKQKLRFLNLSDVRMEELRKL